MANDPIVNDVRGARQRLFEQCGSDLNQLMDRLKADEGQDRQRIVTREALGRGRQARQTTKHPVVPAESAPPPAKCGLQHKTDSRG